MRPLSQLEQALTITNMSYPLAAVSVIRLGKGPSAKGLQVAITRLQNHYSFLRSSIKEKNGGFYFEKDENESPIQLHIIQRKDEKQWLEVTQEELNLGFDHSKSPLLRAIYLTSSSVGEKSEIILSFHHAIMDSVFVMAFIDQLLKIAGVEKSKPENLALSNMKEEVQSPVLEEIFPSNFKKPRIWLRLLPFIFRQLKAELSYKLQNGKVKGSAIPASSENDILILGFSEEETLALIKWSRKNKLSLHSIITATMLWVVNHYCYDDKKKMMRSVQFVSLRPYLQPPVANTVEGCYIAMMRFNIPMSPDSSIDEIAAAIDKQNMVSAKRGDKFIFTLLSKMLIKKSFRENKERLSATALSYAGPIQLKKQYGHIEVSGIHGFITNNRLGPEFSGFGKICFGKLSLDFNFLTAETSKEKAESMAKKIKSLLLQLISEE